MPDPFASQTPSLVSAFENGFAVTPSDGSDQPQVCRGIWVGSAGNLAVTTRGGNTITLVGVAAGTLLPIRATRILATGTTATNIVALY